jgi:tetratricopeptide (TPR) repeat protein
MTGLYREPIPSMVCPVSEGLLGLERVRSKLGWFAGLVAFLWVFVAQAAGPDATSKRLDAIRTQMESGQAKYVSGDYTGAAAVFEAGFKSHPYSAFLFNAGVCYQKLGDREQALAKFKEYLNVDPNAPDRDRVKQRIQALEALVPATPTPPGEAPPGGTPPGQTPSIADENIAMKSLVVIETEPAGAPLKLYSQTTPGVAPFRAGAANPGWIEVHSAVSPTDVTLDVGRYHVVVEKFLDFNVSETDIDVLPGHVHHFKANLSQGAFMAFLRVASNVRDASIYLDDPGKKKPAWGLTPHGELVTSGAHSVLVEAPGYEPRTMEIALNHGEQKEISLELTRVNFGYLRVHAPRARQIEVTVDGRSKGSWQSGEAPLAIKLSSGPHKLVVKSDGRKTFEGTVEVPRGQVQPVSVRMIPKYPRGGAWAEAIIAGVTLGTGIWLGTESDRIYDELEADRRAGVLTSDDDRTTKGKWLAIGADAGFVLTGALAGLATYNFLKDPLPESSIQLERRTEFDASLPQASRLGLRPVASLPPRRSAAVLGLRGVE